MYGLAIGGLLYLFLRDSQDGPGNTSLFSSGSHLDFGGIGSNIVETFSIIKTGFTDMATGGWLKVLNTKGAPYKAALAASEIKHGIPTNMLARLAYQESAYNPRAYNKSGATGLMQIIPRWHPTVDATDPFASIDYAGKFLAQLYKATGSWELALKSYNWGLGNVRKWLAGKLAQPIQTKLYSAEILADLNVVTA